MYVQFAICQRFTDTIVHPDLWKDPNDFIPERWLGADGVTVIPGNDKHPFAWLPFLAGERSCIGRGFAEKEYMCLLALMVWPAVCMHNCICICTSICTHSLSLSHTHTHTPGPARRAEYSARMPSHPGKGCHYPGLAVINMRAHTCIRTHFSCARIQTSTRTHLTRTHARTHARASLFLSFSLSLSLSLTHTHTHTQRTDAASKVADDMQDAKSAQDRRRIALLLSTRAEPCVALVYLRK